MRIFSILCALFLVSAQAQAQASFTLNSVAFDNNAPLPLKYSGKGKDLSPPLAWQNPPAGTQSYALICDDPEAPSGTWTHWVLYSIPSSVKNIAEGEENLPKNAILGKNSWGKTSYNGPNPPSGTHHYYFTLYALDAPLALPSGLTSDQLQQAMKDHILGKAILVGTFTKQ
ncbi:YbhB/YbcL family Raf kinase inhibitor-like protein [Kamptonema cortianum]|jgi:Raf kinase inhibitor-like YbhB/YbcL family protein|nr:YbhB/YbcL family Raf kinase inhibitor-like protein [Geitlerinema splendidum]MDK3161360.1 YbhB/YbcL family Raf kinase inhibitor-like protein [Kamptonema cortianum]